MILVIFTEIKPRLILHVRQLAWLASCPVDITKDKVKDKRNRYQRIEQKIQMLKN